MLGKIKTLFKVFIASIVVIVILFGIYRREYLSQAIPVYMQYLEQRAKWEKMNTGTYAYLLVIRQRGHYLFIENNKPLKMGAHDGSYDLKYLYDEKKTKSFLKHNYLYKGKKYLIDARFDIVKHMIWEKLWIDVLSGKNADRFTYKIGYDFEYAYPRILIADRENNKDKYTLHITYPYTKFVVFELLMLPKGQKFTNQILEDILKKYKASYIKRHHSDIVEDVKMIDAVGGDMIKSAILR